MVSCLKSSPKKVRMVRKLIKDEIDALCKVLRDKWGEDVFVGRPENESAGLYVIPLNIFPDHNQKNAQSPVLRARITVPQPLYIRLQVLITPHPATDLEGLGRAILILHENPVIEAEGGIVRVEFILHKLEEMVAIRAGIDAKLSLAAFYELQYVEKVPAP
jgi:hypothetical protein